MNKEFDWRDFRFKDRGSLTIGFTVLSADELGIWVMLDGNDGGATFIQSEEANAAAWEYREPPLRLGRAQYKPSEESCDVLAINEGWASIKFGNDKRWVTTTDLLINIDE